ncbi:MAG: ATP-binding protein [Methylobacterium organophilum]|nr:ATP-binding protein [Methylobacterium organophilum]
MKIVAHDINNLLAVIDGSLRQMQRHADPAAREALIERMGRAVARGAVLSRRMLDVGRPTRNVPTVSTVRRQLVDLATDLDQALDGTVVVAEIDPDLWAFRADPEELYLALLNLCRNAGDAMPGGGVVLVSARNLAPPPETVHGSVEVSVADCGTGMPEAVMSRVFEPYFTTKEAGKGSGLGLAQVREFVERQDGTIIIESNPGEGTLVRMRLPRSAAPTEDVWGSETKSDEVTPLG